MLKRTICLVTVLGIAVAAAWGFCPGLRTKISQAWNAQTGWTEAARQADPAGFVAHAEAKMKQDLTAMQKARRELAAEVGSLARKTREQTAMATQAQTLAEEFRVEYQAAKANDSFPIEVRGEAYTDVQVRTQVSLLLAEAEGYGQSLAEIDSVQSEAEHQMEELAVRIGKTESQMAALSTKRELLHVRKLTIEGEELLAQVDELMTGNTQAIAGNPIRTVRELVAAEQAKPTGRAPNSKVEEFLAAKPQKKHEVVKPVVEEASVLIQTAYTQERSQQIDQSQKKPAKKQKKQQKSQNQKQKKRQKPIFQQS